MQGSLLTGVQSLPDHAGVISGSNVTPSDEYGSEERARSRRSARPQAVWRFLDAAHKSGRSVDHEWPTEFALIPM